MRVLGLHAVGHDTGACLISDGQACSIAEERLSRRKHDGSFPKRSLDYVLSAAGLREIGEVDLVVTDWIDRRGEAGRSWVRGLGYRGPLETIRHHDAHAASAFFASPFLDAAVLIVDGCGSWGNETSPGSLPHYLHELQEGMVETQSLYRGHGTGLVPIRRTVTTRRYRLGIGFFYAFATLYLGFGELDAGKLMGLAAYGTGSKKIFPRELFLSFDGELLADAAWDWNDRSSWGRYQKRIMGGIAPRRSSDPIRKGHAEIAAFVQSQTEQAMLALARNLHDITRSENLCMAGGVALNCPANSLIMEKSGFPRVFVQSASDDSGAALGCALYGYHVLGGQPRKFAMESAYLGKPYSPGDIKSALHQVTAALRVERPRDVVGRASELLAQGKVLGWFEGGSEIGPRALGHRSILADPRMETMKSTVNRKVKHREWFRPYAPSVSWEDVGRYFDLNVPSPFMLLAPRVKPSRTGDIPAVVHKDGTARVQTVHREQSPRFHDLLAAFGGRTDIPVLLNTSFNRDREPMAESPQDALNILLESRLDALVMEDYLVERST